MILKIKSYAEYVMSIELHMQFHHYSATLVHSLPAIK